MTATDWILVAIFGAELIIIGFLIDLKNKQKVLVGAVGGWCDVVHLNGIGGCGRDWQEALTSGRVPVIDWNMDLLPKSGCIRVFSSHRLMLGDYICSDFNVYDGGKL